MTILKKILLITLAGHIVVFGGDKELPIEIAKEIEQNPQLKSTYDQADLSQYLATHRMFVCATHPLFDQMSYDKNSIYADKTLEYLESFVEYGRSKASFRTNLFGEYISKSKRPDFLKSLFIQKTKKSPEFVFRKDRQSVELKQQLILIGELFLEIGAKEDKDLLSRMLYIADLSFGLSVDKPSLDWAKKCLEYSQRMIRIEPSKSNHIEFLKRYEQLSLFILDSSDVYERSQSIEKEFYQNAIKSADALYMESQETSKWDGLYEMRQVFSKAGAYETSREKKQEYEDKLKQLPFQDLPYNVAGKGIICTPEQIIYIQSQKGLIFDFNPDGTILSVQEKEIAPTNAQKPLTKEQREKKKRKKKAQAIRKKAAKEKEYEESVEVTQDEKNQQIHETPVALKGPKTQELLDINDHDGKEEEFLDVDYQDIIDQAKAKSAAKKVEKFQKQEVVEKETIQVSAEEICVIKNAYFKNLQEQGKVYALLGEIHDLDNKSLKKTQAQHYLRRLSYLLGIKGETSPGLVKILGIPFGYHEVHGSHGNDWTVDMVKRLKTFAVQIRGVFDHITK